MKNFTRKFAGITVAASGMGRRLAHALAERGCNLAIGDINEAGLPKAAAMVVRFEGKVTTVRLYVADRETLFACADRVATNHGRTNLIFNNPGEALGAPREIVEREEFVWVMNINFWGMVWGTQAFLSHLKREGEEHVINAPSQFGILSSLTQGAYRVSKIAVWGSTESSRQEPDLERCSSNATSVHLGGIPTTIAMTARMDASISAQACPRTDPSRAWSSRSPYVTTAESVACEIARSVQRQQRRFLICHDAWSADLLVRTLPSRYQMFSVMVARKLING